jgi:glycerol-3-phosphate dehydrogenase
MSEDHKIEIKGCITEEIPLCGSEFKKYKDVKKYINDIYDRIKDNGFTKYNAWFLVTNYGIQTESILGYYSKRKIKDKEVRMALAELQFGIEYEMVQNPMDFFIRRTGRLYFDIDGVRKLMDPILAEFKEVYKVNDTQIADWKKELNSQIESHSSFTIDRN